MAVDDGCRSFAVLGCCFAVRRRNSIQGARVANVTASGPQLVPSV